MKIMVVEDDKQISLLMCEFLQDEGFEVSVAENGLKALELLKMEGIPDLILLDMMMPLMDGKQFANEFNKKYQNACPIVVISATADIEESAQEINAAEWISKPFKLEDMLNLVKHYASRSDINL